MPTKIIFHSNSSTVKWSLGVVAFLLPVLVAWAGKRLDHSTFRQDPTYKALIPFVAFGSLALALTVPTVFLLTSRWPMARRIAAVLGFCVLLFAEIFWLFFYIVATT